MSEYLGDNDDGGCSIASINVAPALSPNASAHEKNEAAAKARQTLSGRIGMRHHGKDHDDFLAFYQQIQALNEQILLNQVAAAHRINMRNGEHTSDRVSQTAVNLFFASHDLNAKLHEQFELMPSASLELSADNDDRRLDEQVA
ncbi:MAG: hypothetical protein ACPGRX_00190 [Bdellovibrionales bacterium]